MPTNKLGIWSMCRMGSVIGRLLFSR